MSFFATIFMIENTYTALGITCSMKIAKFTQFPVFETAKYLTDHNLKNLLTDRQLILRQRLHGPGSVWDRYEIGTDKPCVYTGPGGSSTDWICYLEPNGSTYEGDPMCKANWILRNCEIWILRNQHFSQHL